MQVSKLVFYPKIYLAPSTKEHPLSFDSILAKAHGGMIWEKKCTPVLFKCILKMLLRDNVTLQQKGRVLMTGKDMRK